MAPENLYAAPTASLDRPADCEGYGELKVWSFRGRIGRLRYLAWASAASFVAWPIIWLVSVLLLQSGDETRSLLIFILVVCYMGFLTINILWLIQRLHDFNLTGWVSFLSIIPLVPLLFMLIPGSNCRNDFGKPPPPNSSGVTILAGLALVAFLLITVAIITIAENLFD